MSDDWDRWGDSYLMGPSNNHVGIDYSKHKEQQEIKPVIMTKEKAESLVVRYMNLFRKDKNYYAFNYALEHTIDQKTGKKRYKKQPWFLEKHN